MLAVLHSPGEDPDSMAPSAEQEAIVKFVVEVVRAGTLAYNHLKDPSSAFGVCVAIAPKTDKIRGTIIKGHEHPQEYNLIHNAPGKPLTLLLSYS